MMGVMRVARSGGTIFAVALTVGLAVSVATLASRLRPAAPEADTQWLADSLGPGTHVYKGAVYQNGLLRPDLTKKMTAELDAAKQSYDATLASLGSNIPDDVRYQLVQDDLARTIGIQRKYDDWLQSLTAAAPPAKPSSPHQ